MALDLPFTAGERGRRPRAARRVDAEPRAGDRRPATTPGSWSASWSATPSATPVRSPTAPCSVSWKSRDDGLDIAVTDGGALTTPERVEAGVSDLAGRGLTIVETLAARWWVESTRSRTTVHALLALA